MLRFFPRISHGHTAGRSTLHHVQENGIGS